MIVIMNDGVNIPWFLPRAIKKFDENELIIVYIPSYDYVDNIGIHHAPGLAKLLTSLAKKKFRKSFNVYRILEFIGLADTKANDFELALDFLLTIWMLHKKKTSEIIEHISHKVGIKHKVLPIIDPLSSTIIKVNDSLVPPMIRDIEEIDIGSIEFRIPDNGSIPESVMEAIKGSNKIVIIGSALSLLYLKRVESLLEIISGYKGQVIYVIPERLSNIDKAVLKHINAEPTFAGLAEALNGNIDALVVNTEDISSLQNISELHFMFYPINFKSDTTEKRKQTVEEFLKILKD